jgi:tetratricopeptide (TPR) repeat protein
LAFARSVEAVGTKLTPALKAQVAELAYHARNYSDTEKYLSGIPESGSGADLASYLRASTYDRKGEISKAISELAEFDKRYPTSALRKGAAEYRATLKIRQNDLSGALDELLKLNYAYDIAYLLDVRMSPEQVRDYVRSHATHPRAELFRISLGFRFLRQSRYDDSIAQFESVPTSKRLKLVQAGSTYADSEPGMPHYDQIPDPVQTARDLKRLESAAGSGANRAAAMYALASYFYTRRNLMLYNAALWNGGRSVLASLNTGVTTPKDADAVRAHSFEHECLYRARKVCLKLAGAFPENPVTAKALYRAATATRRLADFNPYWRSAPKSVVSYEEAASLLKQVYTKFPGDALAANARKYEKVYLEEGEEAMRYRMFSE